ncbi:transposase [Streptococcus pneumoniae]|nr:transposase [Streptococcus pneumoniae]
MTVEEEKVFLDRHLKAAEAGEFVTIDALFQAYKKELGRSYTRDAFYQLFEAPWLAKYYATSRTS